MLPFHYMQEFLVLADTLNYSQAAARTYTTQPVLSRHIVKLEEELGCKLLKRNTRNVSLTEAGVLACDAFRNIEQEHSILRQQLSCLQQGEAGTLRLTAADYFIEDFVEPYLACFSDEHPAVQLQISSSPPDICFESLNSRSADIAVSAFFPALGEQYRRVLFARDKLALICRKDHPLAGKDTVSLQDLRGEEFVSFGGEESFFTVGNTYVLDLLAGHGIYPKAFHFSPNADTLGLTLRKINGVCVLPYSLRHMDRAYLSVKPLEDEDCFLDICLYYRMDNENPLIPAFVQTVLSKSDQTNKTGRCFHAEPGLCSEASVSG